MHIYIYNEIRKLAGCCRICSAIYIYAIRLRGARYGLRIQEGKVGFKGGTRSVAARWKKQI